MAKQDNPTPLPSKIPSSNDQDLDPVSCSLEKFRLYETRARFYLIGSDRAKRWFRVLKIDRSEPSELNISEDPVVYSQQEVKNLLQRIGEGNRSTGGLTFVVKVYGIAGCIKFLESYYLILVTKRRQIGCICGHAIYSIDESQLITVPHSSIQTDVAHSKTELRYKKLLSSVDLTKDFFYSYTYPIMQSLQKNVLAMGEEMMSYENIFVWNAFLTQAIRSRCKNTAWTIALVHGHFKQVRLSIFGREFSVSLISRRSRHFAGTRLHLVRCENTSIHDVSIKGDFDTPNNDGIDIEDSNNTVITRCNINTGDDAICPKTSTGPLYNLTATDCWIRTKSSAIKLGSASWFEFNGLHFNNITIVDSHRGLALQIRDGGNASDITFSNINISTRYYDPSWWGRAEPIYVTTCPRDPNSKAGSITNLHFINISAVSENGVFLSGSVGGGLLSNLKFSNVNLTYRRWTNYSGGLVDYRPGCKGLVNHGTAGVIMEHILGLEMENVDMKWAEGDSKGWNNPLDFRPSTVSKISLFDFHSDLYKQ